MRKIYVLLTLCLLILSVFISCDDKSQGVELVTITLDSGILKEEAKTIETAENTSVILPSGDSLWNTSGYTFSGWAETATGIDKYKAGDKYSSSKSITLYATWTANMVTLKYNANGGEGSIKSVTVAQGEEVTLADGKALSRDGFYLSSWTDGETNYAPGSQLTLTKDVVLYAVWAENYNIKYYSGGKLIATDYPQESSAKIGDGNGLTQEGAELYWTDDTGIPYDVGEIYTGAEDLSLYAKWQDNDGTLKYELDTTTKTYSVKATEKNISGVITIPGTYKEKDVTAIAESAFEDCSSLTGVTIPSTITSIGDKAFSGCKDLSSVDFGEEVRSIGKNAFRGCSQLTEISIPSSVSEIASNAFSDDYSCCNLNSIYINKTEDAKETLRPGENNWGAYLATVYWTGNYKVDDKGVLTIDDTDLVKGSILLPDKVNMQDVKSIKEGAFYGCTELTDISIPSSVTSIGGDAFSGCSSLKSIYIDNIKGAEGAPTDAPWGALESTTVYWTGNFRINYVYRDLQVKDKNLVEGSIVLPDKVNGEEVTSIGYFAFADCQNLTSISIPATVSSIYYNAFQNCTSLRSITIPSSVEYIYESVFNNCSNLTTIKYQSTKADWESHVGKNTKWKDGSSIKTVECTDGDITYDD